MNFTCWSWNYKSGFGGRVVPTKTQRTAVSASFDAPQGQIEPSVFFDEEAEQVRQKFIEEQKEAEETLEMGLHDRLPPAAVEDSQNGLWSLTMRLKLWRNSHKPLHLQLRRSILRFLVSVLQLLPLHQ